MIDREKMKSKWMGQHLIYKEETDSTNLEAVRNVDALPHGAVVVADSQTAGVGRRGRKWHSPAGQNLYFSVSLKPGFQPDKASMLTLVMAMAVAKAIREVSGTETKIKWPNDIVMGGKKVCGILTQMELLGTDIKQVIVGVGINVNQRVFADNDLQYASSLQIETGTVCDRSALLAEVLYQFECFYEQFEKEQKLSFLKTDYESVLANLGKYVQILDPMGTYEAVALGINELGELIVQKDDGTIEAVYAGEVSVRGLYGYV